MNLILTKDYLVNESIILKKGSIIEVDKSEILYELRNKSYSNVKERIEDTMFVRLEHLIKLFYYRGQGRYEYDENGWKLSCRHGFENLITVNKAFGKNSHPKADKLFHDIWENNEDDYNKYHDKLIKDLNKKYKDYLPINNICKNAVMTLCKEYHKWAFNIIESDGFISMSEAEEKIDELLNEYSPFNENNTCDEKE